MLTTLASQHPDILILYSLGTEIDVLSNDEDHKVLLWENKIAQLRHDRTTEDTGQSVDEVIFDDFIFPAEVSKLDRSEIGVYEESILDWDITIETAPSRPSGTIQVQLEYRGRSTPIPVEDPWEN